MTSELLKELADLSVQHQNELVAADEAGEDSELAYQRLRIKYMDLYNAIIKRDVGAPVFRVEQPAAHRITKSSDPTAEQGSSVGATHPLKVG